MPCTRQGLVWFGAGILTVEIKKEELSSFPELPLAFIRLEQFAIYFGECVRLTASRVAENPDMAGK